MLIAFFTNNYKPFVGGVPIAVENVAKALRRRGHRVLIFAPEYDGVVDDEPDVFRVLSIKNFNDSPFSLPLPLTLRPSYDLDALSEVDVVHVHHPFLLGMSGLHLARAYNLPVVFTYHTQYEKYIHYLPFPEKMTAELAVRLSTRFANSCDAVIAPSIDILRVLRERGVEVPIHVIPTGVDLRRFRGGAPTYLRRRLGFSENVAILLTVSRLAREKNVDVLIRVFARIQAFHKQCVFVVVGEGDAQTELQNLAHELNVADKTFFLGALTGKELVSAYKSADVFMFASTTETQGMVVVEAMACELPVVAISAPGVRDCVMNGENGYLVEEGQIDDFAERVLTLIHEPELLTRLRRKAKETARRFSLARTTAQLERVYKRLVGNPASRRKRERFIMIRELVSYQFSKLIEELEKLV